MLRKFTHAFHIPGTLGADLNIRLTVPSNCQITHVSAVASNNSDATLAMGTSADTNGFLAAIAIGDSNTPTEFDLDDFDGALLTNAGEENPALDDGDILVLILDHDGASGTAAADVTIVLTFTEG